MHTSNKLELPKLALTGEISLEQLLAQRRSLREYPDTALSLAEIDQILWEAQGITHAEGLRTAPSAGALYPLELYVVAGRVEGLAQGVYHYEPERHQLTKTSDEDIREALARAALSQSCVNDAPAVIVFTADYARTAKKYGNRGRRYVDMEVGHAVGQVCDLSLINGRSQTCPTTGKKSCRGVAHAQLFRREDLPKGRSFSAAAHTPACCGTW